MNYPYVKTSKKKIKMDKSIIQKVLSFFYIDNANGYRITSPFGRNYLILITLFFFMLIILHYEDYNFSYDLGALMISLKKPAYFLTKNLKNKIIVRNYPGSQQIQKLPYQVAGNFNQLLLKNPILLPKLPRYLSNDILRTCLYKHALVREQMNIFKFHIYFNNKNAPTDFLIPFFERKQFLKNLKHEEALYTLLNKKNTLIENLQHLQEIIEKKLKIPPSLISIIGENLKSIYIGTLSNEEKELIKNIEVILNMYLHEKKNVKLEEKEISLTSDPLQAKINIFLLKKIPSRLFSIKDLKDELDRCELGLNLLRDHFNDLTTSQIIEILVKSKILKYPDVYYKDVIREHDKLVCEEHIQRKAEGPKITSDAWALIKNDPSLGYLINAYPPPSPELMNLILKNIKEKI